MYEAVLHFNNIFFFLLLSLAFMEKSYPVIRTAFSFCQFFQILEILHPLLGYTSGSALPPFLQVCMVIECITDKCSILFFGNECKEI